MAFMVLDKSIIYYTDNRLDEKIFNAVQKRLLAVGLPIVSCSLKPINYGTNIVLNLKPGIITMYRQILAALEASETDTIFFCEHDVLYHPSHFDFEPPRTDMFYYNVNVWRWKYPNDFAITYENIVSQSNLCANRNLAIGHYKKRLETIENNGWRLSYGFEPGTKNVKRGGVSNESSDLWKSEYPNIDIRHGKTITPIKCDLKSFKHPPDVNTWKETQVSKLEGWEQYDFFLSGN